MPLLGVPERILSPNLEGPGYGLTCRFCCKPLVFVALQCRSLSMIQRRVWANLCSPMGNADPWLISRPHRIFAHNMCLHHHWKQGHSLEHLSCHLASVCFQISNIKHLSCETPFVWWNLQGVSVVSFPGVTCTCGHSRLVRQLLSQPDSPKVAHSGLH